MHILLRDEQKEFEIATGYKGVPIKTGFLASAFQFYGNGTNFSFVYFHPSTHISYAGNVANVEVLLITSHF